MLISQGAEGRLYAIDFMDKKAIAKQRFKKKYRHPQLDELLTKERVVQEARQLQRLQSIVRTPTLYLVDIANATIYMEFIPFPTVREIIQGWEQSNTNDKVKALGERIGTELASIHNQDCIHGDLTTSNLLFNDQLVWIDFGLSYISTLAEDKGVDLYVLERAIQSTHPIFGDLVFSAIFEAYSSVIENKEVITRFQQVRLRGRKRSQLG